MFWGLYWVPLILGNYFTYSEVPGWILITAASDRVNLLGLCCKGTIFVCNLEAVSVVAFGVMKHGRCKETSICLWRAKYYWRLV